LNVDLEWAIGEPARLSMEKQYRKLARRFYRYLRHPRRRRNSRVLGWVGDRFADRRLWRPTTQSFAPGLATGFCVAMLPFFVPQMLIAAIVCLWRRWNLPLAVAACWISNAFTWIPQIIYQLRLGTWILTSMGVEVIPPEEELEQLEQAQDEDIEVSKERVFDLLSRHLLAWSFGLVGSMAVAAVVGYVLGKILWSFVGHRVPVPHLGVKRRKREDDGAEQGYNKDDILKDPGKTRDGE